MMLVISEWRWRHCTVLAKHAPHAIFQIQLGCPNQTNVLLEVIGSLVPVTILLSLVFQLHLLVLQLQPMLHLILQQLKFKLQFQWLGNQALLPSSKIHAQKRQEVMLPFLALLLLQHLVQCVKNKTVPVWYVRKYHFITIACIHTVIGAANF